MAKAKVKAPKKGMKRQGIRSFVAVRTWFKCDVYPDRHPSDAHEIEEHFFTISQEGNTISEEDVLGHHTDKFPYHEVIDHTVGRPWHYQRDRYGKRV